MSDRVLLRVMCSKTKGAHVIGTVRRTADGVLELHYKTAVRLGVTGRDSQDFRAQDAVSRDTPGVVTGTDAFCVSCNQRYDLVSVRIFEAASRGVPIFKLQGRNAEARWKAKHPQVD